MNILGSLIAKPDDPGGFGLWLMCHYLDHQALAQAALKALPKGTRMPLYDIALWRPQLKEWVPSHYEMHVALGSALRVAVNDLTGVDWQDPASWGTFMAYNAEDHFAFHKALGV